MEPAGNGQSHRADLRPPGRSDVRQRGSNVTVSEQLLVAVVTG
jgi:hypothetical protein